MKWSRAATRSPGNSVLEHCRRKCNVAGSRVSHPLPRRLDRHRHCVGGRRHRLVLEAINQQIGRLGRCALRLGKALQSDPFRGAFLAAVRLCLIQTPTFMQSTIL